MLKRLAGTVVLVALVAGGCGESELDKFSEEYNPINDRLLALGATLAKDLREIPSRTPAQNATAMSKAAAETGAVRRELVAIDPPSEVKADMGKLTVALAGVQKGLADLARRAKDNEKLETREVLREFGPSARGVDQAQNAVAGATGGRAN